MKRAAFAIALLMSGAAIAQQPMTPETDLNPAMETIAPDAAPATESVVDDAANPNLPNQAARPVNTTESATAESDMVPTSAVPTTTMASLTPASGSVVQPSNANPERDARGIAVLSDPATVPGGWNGGVSTGEGGPLLDPVTGNAIEAADTYPACSATITDNCLQAYERPHA